MKRSQTEIVVGTTQPTSNDLDTIKKAYKRAKAAYEGDKSNKELKKAKKAAKNKWKGAENAAAATLNDEETSPMGKEKEGSNISKEKKVDGNDDDANAKSSSESEEADNANDASSSSSPDTKTLEEAYQNALSAFKADKSNKELRRTKTAARRALDAAIAASHPEGSKQLTCLDCSKMFIFTSEEQKKYKKMKWKEMPKRCETCKSSKVERMATQRSKLDSKKRNMCYAFQAGECSKGEKCKFSHNPNHAGGSKQRNYTVKKENYLGSTDVETAKEN